MNKKTGYITYLKNNLISKLFSSRMLLVLVVQIIFHDRYLRSLRNLAVQYDEQVSPFVFPLLCGGLTFTLLFGFCVLYMFSDVPYMNRKEMYYLIRCGRRGWVCIQEITIACMSIAMIVSGFLFDMVRLFPYISFADKWDKVQLSLAYGSITATGVGSEMAILQMYSPWQLLLWGLGMGILVVNLIGRIMYTCSLLFRRLTAVIVGFILALMPIICANSSNMWSFVYYISPISWIYPGYYIHAISVPDMVYKVVVCIGGCAICTVIDNLVIQKRDFDWNMEE